MAIPTDTEIEEAVPTDGEPSRALVQALLKALIAEISYTPEDGTIPARSVENENFSGGRLKASPGTDPDDCVNLAQLTAMLPSFMNRQITTAPTSPTSSGEKGDYAITSEEIYFCIAKDTWRMIQLLAWGD